MLKAAKYLHRKLIGRQLRQNGEEVTILGENFRVSLPHQEGYCLPARTKSGTIKAIPLSKLSSYELLSSQDSMFDSGDLENQFGFECVEDSEDGDFSTKTQFKNYLNNHPFWSLESMTQCAQSQPKCKEHHPCDGGFDYASNELRERL